MIFKAIKFVAEAHEGHYRKGSKLPYITHLVDVMKILAEHECEESVLVAGLLHDAVEDTPVTIAQIEAEFGREVAAIVAGASEPSKLGEPPAVPVSWHERKQHTIDFLAGKAGRQVLLVTCADKLDNIRSTQKALEKVGEAVWDRFNAPKADQKWYFESLAAALEKRAEQAGSPLPALVRELRHRVDAVFGS